MKERLVYLSGPISGCSLEEAQGWRSYVRQRLSPKISTIDPTRDAVDVSVSSEQDFDDSARYRQWMHGKQILDRNRTDIAGCDLVLVNFLGARRISIGSVGEIFWADAFRKPVIVVRKSSHDLHDHGLINAIAIQIVSSLDDAIERINRLLS